MYLVPFTRGREKIFEVRANYSDVLFLQEFLTQDFCEKYEFFQWERLPEGKYVIGSRDASAIRSALLSNLENRGQPIISLINANGFGKGVLELKHQWSGRPLEAKYSRTTLQRLYQVWKRPCSPRTQNASGENRYYLCTGAEQVLELSLPEYEKGDAI